MSPGTNLHDAQPGRKSEASKDNEQYAIAKMTSPESGVGEEHSSSGSSSDDEPAFVNSLARSQPPQKKQKREEPVPFEALQQAG